MAFADRPAFFLLLVGNPLLELSNKGGGDLSEADAGLAADARVNLLLTHNRAS